MLNDEIQYEFIGFEPSLRQKNMIRSTMERLMWESPSDASLKLTIVKTPGAYSATCRVSSSIGIFIGDGKSEYLKPAIKLLESKLRKQLFFWKGQRTLSEQRENILTDKRVS